MAKYISRSMITAVLEYTRIAEFNVCSRVFQAIASFMCDGNGDLGKDIKKGVEAAGIIKFQDRTFFDKGLPEDDCDFLRAWDIILSLDNTARAVIKDLAIGHLRNKHGGMTTVEVDNIRKNLVIDGLEVNPTNNGRYHSACQQAEALYQQFQKTCVDLYAAGKGLPPVTKLNDVLGLQGINWEDERKAMEDERVVLQEAMDNKGKIDLTEDTLEASLQRMINQLHDHVIRCNARIDALSQLLRVIQSGPKGQPWHEGIRELVNCYDPNKHVK